MWPSFTKHHQVRTFKKFLTIQTSKADPPRLAFDEINSEERRAQKNDWDLMRAKSGGTLLVGETAPQFAARSPAQSLRTRKIVLRTMSFTHAEVAAVQQEREWIQDLPASAQARVQEAQQRFGTLDEEWQPPTFKEQAATRIQEAHRQLEAEDAAKKSASNIIVQSVQDDGSTQDSIRKSDVAVREDKTDIVLNGMIELRGLPPPTDSRWRMTVSRYDDDVKQEDANVDVKSSTYRIRVPNMEGTLVATLVDTTTGLSIGEGRMRLSEYNSTAQRKITISKVFHDVASNFDNFYDHATRLRGGIASRKAPVQTKVLFASVAAEGKTDKGGGYHFEQVQKGSWALLRTETKGFYGGIHLIQSGKENHEPLFPENMIKALRQISEDQSLTSEFQTNGSVVWGQVTQNGKPLANAQVQVEGFENAKPIYFNQLLLPDSAMKGTSENGYFAFVNLPAGFHAISARFGTTSISHANVVVDDETVSIAELESRLQTEKSNLKVFDAFTGQPQVATLDLQSLPQALEVRGYAEINMPDLDRLSLMKVTPQDPAFSESLQMYEDSMDSVHVPLVRTDWIQNLMSQRKSNVEPETGVVVGFVPSSEFEVYMGHDPNFPKDQIIYFDPQGQVTTQGVPGGGFILFNVPKGVQSIVIADTKNDLLQTQVIPMDESALVTLKFR